MPDFKTLEYSISKLHRQAMLDLDGDGTAEHIIQSPDQEYIILREYNGKVYSYCLDSCDYYRFNTDGTFFWCNSPKTVERECGLSKKQYMVYLCYSTLVCKGAWKSCLKKKENHQL